MFSCLRQSKLALLVSLSVISSTSPSVRISAQGVVPCVHEARYGLTGLARLQVARLSMVNVLPPDPETQPPDPVHPPDPMVSANRVTSRSGS